MKSFDKIVLILMIIGSINWGLIGVFNFNLVTAIFGSFGWLVNLIYILVGLSGLYSVKMLMK